jgi:hypothetical protein
MIAVTRLAAGLYFGGNRISGVGSIILDRGRGAPGAGGRDVLVTVGRDCFGDGARNGARGRGIVVVRCEGRSSGEVEGFAA